MANKDLARVVLAMEAEVNKLRRDMDKSVDVVQGATNKMERASNKAARGMEASMTRAASKMGGAMKTFGIGVASGMVAALAPMALFNKALKDISETAALKRLADRIGLSTTSLQALQFAATQAGVNIDQMGDGLGDFAAKVAEAAAGAGPLKDIFKANGVELKKQDGTLRSTRDILGEYANLIKNAQSPAEQLFLAQQAFGDEAAKMVPIFKDGARGIEQLEVNAKAAGVVIDEELVKRAEELDKRMAGMWATFAARSKSAILTAIQGMDGLLAQLADYEKRKKAAELGALAGSLVKPKGSVLTTPTSDKPTALDARMAGALTTELSAADQKLVDALQKRYGEAANKATIIPSGSGDGGGSKGGGLKEKLDYAERVIEALEREKSLIGASALEIEKSNALWRAGKDATAEQKAEIESLVTAIYTANEAHEAQTRALEETRDAARDFAGTLVDGLLEGKDASDVLSNALKQLGSRLLNSGLDALFGIGGGGGANPFGIIGKMLGLADGGRVRGPGTGRSDSIPARLSDGEFVVNAASTRKNLPLLEAINNDNIKGLFEKHVGKVQHFAKGGLASLVPSGERGAELIIERAA